MPVDEFYHRDNVPAARQLRRPLTPTEHTLWAALRARRLGGWKFRRQHPVGGFVLDFYCAEAHLAVEVDGGVHDLPEQRARDRDRQSLLEAWGIVFLRFPAWRVERELTEVLATLQATSERLAGSPSPPPLSLRRDRGDNR